MLQRNNFLRAEHFVSGGNIVGAVNCFQDIAERYRFCDFRAPMKIIPRLVLCKDSAFA